MLVFVGGSDDVGVFLCEVSWPCLQFTPRHQVGLVHSCSGVSNSTCRRCSFDPGREARGPSLEVETNEGVTSGGLLGDEGARYFFGCMQLS